MVRLHMDEAKLCILFSLVPRASVSSRDQRALCRCWSYCILLLGYLFSSLQMVSGQQILEACMKNFVIVLRLVVHIHASRKNQVQRCNEHGSQNACHHFISSFFVRDFS